MLSIWKHPTCHSSPPVSLIVPNITVDIRSDINAPAILGQDYSFMCAVTIDSDIDSDITYTLLHNNVSDILEVPVVSFQPLTVTDGGIYQCMVEISSPYLTDPVVRTTLPEEQNITFQCEL